jgi:hypothetical protein
VWKSGGQDVLPDRMGLTDRAMFSTPFSGVHVSYPRFSAVVNATTVLGFNGSARLWDTIIHKSKEHEDDHLSHHRLVIQAITNHVAMFQFEIIAWIEADDRRVKTLFAFILVESSLMGLKKNKEFVRYLSKCRLDMNESKPDGN